MTNLHQADPEACKKIGEMIHEIDIALMVTHDAQGNLHARPMSTQKEKGDKPFTGELWFMTDRNSPKIQEIKNDPRILMNYADRHAQNYITLSGKAEVVMDQSKVNELWHEPLRAWFPKGPDDPSIALIRVDADSAEYWDAPSQTVLHAIGYFKARLTGERPQMGEHKKIAV